MSTLPALRAAMVGRSAITAELGERIYYSTAPQGSPLPFAVITGSRSAEDYALAGTTGITDGAATVIVLGATFTEVERIGNVITSELMNFRGTVTGKTITIFREPQDASDFIPAEGRHRRIMGFRVVATG